MTNMATITVEPQQSNTQFKVGFITADLVGLQYYTNIGTIKDGEFLEFVRELANSFDFNAIKVLNKGGKQLGYLEHTVAGALAPLIDQDCILLTHGIVPKSIPFAYKMPCQIHISAKRIPVTAALDLIKLAGFKVVTAVEQGSLEENFEEKSRLEERSGSHKNLEESAASPKDLEKSSGSHNNLEEFCGSPKKPEKVSGPHNNLEEFCGSPKNLEEISGSLKNLEESFGSEGNSGSPNPDGNFGSHKNLEGNFVSVGNELFGTSKNLEEKFGSPEQLLGKFESSGNGCFGPPKNPEVNFGSPKKLEESFVSLHNLEREFGSSKNVCFGHSKKLEENFGSEKKLEENFGSETNLEKTFGSPEKLEENFGSSMNLEEKVGSDRNDFFRPSTNLEETFGLTKHLEELCGSFQKRECMEPSAIVSPLLQHQKEALAWMVKRENSAEFLPFWEVSCKSQETACKNILTSFETIQRPSLLKGGVLADEMILDRNLILLSLIVTNRPVAQLGPMVDLESSARNCRSPKRKRNDRSVVADSSPKSTHRFEPPDPRGPKTTLIVCSSSMIASWEMQIKKHTQPGSLQVYPYHSPECTKEGKELCKFDVVVTSYGTLAGELDCSSSPMRKMEWLRVILDEAQFIKNVGTKEAMSVIGLKAQRRWVVTSTPIEKISFDLFFVMAFLNFQQFSIQYPLTQGSAISQSRLQASRETNALGRTKVPNGQRVEVVKAMVNKEGSGGHSKDGQSLEAKETKVKEEQAVGKAVMKGQTLKKEKVVMNEEVSDGDSKYCESLEAKVSKKKEKEEEVKEKSQEAAEARTYFGALFGDNEGIYFDFNITSSPVHDVVEGTSHANAEKLQDEGAYVTDSSQQPIKADSEASLKKCGSSYEENQAGGTKKEANEDDGDKKDSDSDNSKFYPLRAMLEAAETSSLPRDQVKKLLLKTVDIALGGNDPWQERTIKLTEEINKSKVEMASIRDSISQKDEMMKRHAKYIQCEEWGQALEKSWEEVNKVMRNSSGVLDVQSTNSCDDQGLESAIDTLRWMTNLLKQSVDVALVYHTQGYDMQRRNEELTKSVEEIEEELVTIKQELQEAKAMLADTIAKAKDESRKESQLKEKMERELEELRKEKEHMKKDMEKILWASKALYEENKELVKTLIAAGSLMTPTSQAAAAEL